MYREGYGQIVQRMYRVEWKFWANSVENVESREKVMGQYFLCLGD